MKIAIYTRKSKYSDKSESIDSQIDYCKQSAKLRYPNDELEFITYVDEGFSGGTIERPHLKKLIMNIKNDKDFNAVICYKIDRISRSLADFTNLQQVLDKAGVHIISASEGFDTSTTWGAAVLNILMIFAQIERNNTSERIRDTMLHYARQGRWTGGLTPTGFESKSIPYTDAFNQEKNMVILVPVDEEIKIIKTIYEKYIELQSLNLVETYMAQNDIKTKKNNTYSVSTIREILINPVYAVADNDLYNFFSNKGSELCNSEKEYDGSFSVLPYNRVDKKKLIKRPICDWIVAISKHQGIISGKDWVKVQSIIAVNSEKKPRLGTAQHGIFSGMIKCKECGSTMRIKNGRINQYGVKEFYYVCNLKEISKQTKCNMKNLSGHKIEFEILEKIKEYTNDGELLSNLARKNKMHLSTEMTDKKLSYERLKADLGTKELAIKNLVMQVSQTDNMGAGKYLLEQIEEIDKTITDLKHRIAVLEIQLSEEKEKELDILSLVSIFESVQEIDKMKDVIKKRRLMKSIIEKMEWNGAIMSIHFKTGDSISLDDDTLLCNLQTFNDHRQSTCP